MNNSQTIFSKISNILFFIFSLFLLSFIWINFYLRNFNKALISSIIISLAIFIILTTVKIKLNKKNKISKNKIKKTEYLITQLILGNDEKNIPILIKAFNLNDLKTTESKNHYINHNTQTDIFFIFNNNTLSEDDITNIYKTKKFNNIQIFCISSTFIPNDLNNKFTFITIEDTYNKLDEKNLIIDNNIQITKKNKITFKDILKTIFSSKKSKSYFGFGMLLIFTSLFTPYSIYYLVIGTILVISSIYCKFNKRFN